MLYNKVDQLEQTILLRALLLLANITGIPRMMLQLILDSRVPLRLKMLLPAAFIYVLSPLDIVSDIIPVFGWIDDAFIVGLFVVAFLALAPKVVVAEHLRRQER